MPIICPFCDRANPDADHMLAFHRDRLMASMVYRDQLAAGLPEPAARAAANAVVWHRGPGQHDRVVITGVAA